jgi:hypothetical protein
MGLRTRIRTRAGANTAVPLLGTLSATAAGAYSFRLIKPGYAGKACRVQRSSDSTQLDIGFTAAGDLDEAAMTTFVGANSAFVATLYDQSGNARNLTQAVTANMPRIINVGTIDRLSTRAAFRTDGTAQNLVTATFALAQPFTRSTVLQFLAVPAVGDYTANFDTFSPVMLGAGAGVVAMYAGAQLNFKSGIALNDKATVVEIYNGVSSTGIYNATSVSGAAGANPGAGLQVGHGSDGFTTALFGELILFTTGLSAGDQTALQASQKNYFGTP